MTGLFQALEGEHQTPVGAGLMMLALNVGLMFSFVLAIALTFPLRTVGIDVPPWAIMLLFGIVAVGLWLRCGWSLAVPFSYPRAILASLVGMAPIAAVTAAEYAFLLIDPEGCVGAHLMILLLGSVSLVAMGIATSVGFAARRRFASTD